MLLGDVSDERLREMKDRLMMEGIFHREIKARELAEKTIAILEEIKPALWLIRNFGSQMDSVISQEDLKAAAESIGCPVEELSMKRWYRRYYDLHQLCEDVVKEMVAEIAALG